MSEFWTYEDKRTYDKRLAQVFESEAKKYLWGDMSGSPMPGTMNESLRGSDLNDIVPKQGERKRGGSILGKAVDFVDDVSSAAFLGEVRQPWDVLRPLSRLFEAESKYIARPLARKALEPLGVNFDELPGIAQFGIEAVTSPSSWVGVGLLGKGAKALKLAPGLAKYAAAESLPEYLLKNAVPNIVGGAASGAAEDLGLPPWTGLPLAIASSKGVDFYYGQAGAVRNLPKNTPMSIVIPDGKKVFHGTKTNPIDISPGPQLEGYPFSGEGSPELGPSTKFRHAPEGGFRGIFFTSSPSSYETENYGAGFKNRIPTVEDLKQLQPGQTMGNNHIRRDVNVSRLTPKPDELARAEKLRAAGTPVSPSYSTAKYSVYENQGSSAATSTVSYFENEQDVLDYLSAEVKDTPRRNMAPWHKPGPRWGEQTISENSRIYPALLKPGTKLWDPHVDPHPEMFADEMRHNADLRRHMEIDADPNAGYTVPVFYQEAFSRAKRAKLQQELEREGYSGFQTRHELLIWDQDALVPLFEARGREWDAAEGMKRATRRNPGLAMSVPALAAAFPAAGSARAFGLGIMGDSDFSPEGDQLLRGVRRTDTNYAKEVDAIETVYGVEASKSGISMPMKDRFAELQSVDEINEGIRQFKEVEQGFANSSSPEALRRGIQLAEDTIASIDEDLKRTDLSPAARVNNNRMREIQEEARDRWGKALMEKTAKQPLDWSRGPRMGITGDDAFNSDWLKDWQDSLDLARNPEKFKAAQEAKRAQVAKNLEARRKGKKEDYTLMGRAKKLTRISEQLKNPPGPNAIINPEDRNVYHGTRESGYDFPEPQQGESWKASYWSEDPGSSEVEFATGLWNGSATDYIPPETRVYPGTLPKGTKIFDPWKDKWPKGTEDIKLKLEEAPHRPGEGFASQGMLMDWDPKNRSDLTVHMFDALSKQEKVALRQGLMAEGYDVIQTPHEIISFDKDLIKPRYEHEAGLVEPVRQPPNMRGAGAMRAQPEQFAENMTRIFESGVQDVYGWRSTEDALMHGYQNRSFTQWFRERIADMIPQTWVDSLEGKGIRLRDDELSYLIRGRGRMINQSETYAAVMGDLHRSLMSKQGVANRNLRDVGTIITDPAIIASAKALEASRPGLKLLDVAGRLHDTDFFSYAKALGVTPDQEAWIRAHAELASAADGMDRAMKSKIQGVVETDDGWDFHRQQLTRPVTVTDPKSLAKYPVQVKEGPVLRTRIGATQTAGKPRDIRTKAEGVDAGITYLNFEDAQKARYAQGGLTSADEWLMSATSDLSRKPSQLIDPAIGTALADSIALRRQYQWLENELKQSISRPMKNSFRAPRFAIRPELKDMFEQAMWTGAIPKQDQRLAGWRAVRERITAEKAPWEANYEGLSKARKDALKQVQAYGTEEFPVDFGGRRFPLREGRQMAALVKPAANGIAEQTLGAFNKNVRPLMATLDASFMGIQGLMSFFVDPGAWMSAFKHGIMGDYDAYIQGKFASGLLDTARESGVYYAARNDFGEFIFPQSVLRLPGIGKAADLSNTWFTNFGNVLRLEMFDVGVKGGMDVTQLEKLGRTVNLATGFNPGKPTSIETIATFAPRFFRAQLGLVTDALTKTVTKNQQGEFGVDLSRASAARNIGQLVALGSALTVGVNQALGQETVFDPADPNFMRIRGLGRDISVFGPWDSLVRAMSTLATDGPDAAAVYLARSKASPAFGRIIDVIDGETFAGDKMAFGTPEEIGNSALNMLKASGPISASTIAQEGLPTNPTELAGAGLGFLGIKASPLSGYEQLINTQEDLARTHFNSTWDKLEPYQKNELRQKYDLELESSSDVQKAFDLRAKIDQRFNARQLELDDDFPIGKDWIEARQKLHQEQVGAYGQWSEANPEAAARIRAGKPSNPQDQVRQQYYSIFDKASQEDWTPAETSEAITQFEEGLSDAQKAYLDRNLGLKDTPRVKEYKAAQKLLRPYWQFADEVWDKYKTRNPEAAEFGSIQEYQNALIERYQQEGLTDERIIARVRDNPLMRSAQRATDEVRRRYRVQNREVDRLLTKWYGYTPISKSR